MSLDRLDDDPELFGPGTDLTLSLAAVLIVATVTTLWVRGDFDLRRVRERQLEVVHAIADAFDTDAASHSPGVHEVRTPTPGAVLRIENVATLQRIRFGDQILFESDDHLLKPEGRAVLAQVAETLRSRLDWIGQIQIEGHADTNPTAKYRSNLDLASQRAVTVFEFLRAAGIDPMRHLMSASSFGEFFPAARRGEDDFDEAQLLASNQSAAQRRLNRRIEIVLIYREETR